jgi:hypothetical protein
MRCKQTERLPVTTEWQGQVLCPQCKHYWQGQCGNAARCNGDDPCPFDSVSVSQFAGPVCSEPPKLPSQAG